MKKGYILAALGAIGIAQYAYFQLFTKWALNAEYKLVLENIGGVQVPMVHAVITRDWTAGIIGVVIGIVLLVVGISFIRRYRHLRASES